MGKLTCRRFVQNLLKSINVIFALIGLTMLGYGIYMLFSYNTSSLSFSSSIMSLSPQPLGTPPLDCNSFECKIIDDRYNIRRFILQKHMDSHPFTLVWSDLPSMRFLCLFTIVGGVVIFITCFGYIAAATTNGCCVSYYSFLLGILLVLEIALVAVIYVDSSWQNLIPGDTTIELHSIENFFPGKVNVLKWISLAIILLQAFALILSVTLRMIGSSTRMHNDTTDNYIAQRELCQALLYRQMNSSICTNPKVTDGCIIRTHS